MSKKRKQKQDTQNKKLQELRGALKAAAKITDAGKKFLTLQGVVEEANACFSQINSDIQQQSMLLRKSSTARAVLDSILFCTFVYPLVRLTLVDSALARREVRRNADYKSALEEIRAAAQEEISSLEKNRIEEILLSKDGKDILKDYPQVAQKFASVQIEKTRVQIDNQQNKRTPGRLNP